MAQGCYKPKYLPGSFRGVAFKVEEATSDHGRRGAEGEFPFGESTAYADLGRRIRTYSLSARFDGNNHLLRATALVAACELRGPGILVHPTRGVILSAACKSLKVTDKVEEEQGVTRVDMEFVEANNWPNGLSLVGSLLGIVLSAIINPARTSLLANYTPATVQPFRKTAVLNAAQSQIAFIKQEYEKATVSKATETQRNAVVSDLDRLSSDDGLAETPATMDRGIAIGLQAVALELTGVAKFRAFRRIANNAAKTSTFGAPASTTENAVYSAVRIISAAYMTQGVLEATDQKTNEVFDQLDVIEAVLVDEQAFARSTCDNLLQLAISDFRTDAAAKMYDNAYNSPGLVTYNFSSSVHPVVAAYSAYNDAKRHREMEAYNTISTSGRFGGQVLTVRA